MAKFWAILMVFIQLNYGLVASVSTGSIKALLSAEPTDSQAQSVTHPSGNSSDHSTGNTGEQSPDKAVENSSAETEFVDNTSFHFIEALAVPASDLSFCEYYLHHLPAVFTDIDIPPPRA